MNCECPHCPTVYQVEDAGLGQKMVCENCHKKFFVPKPQTQICPDCGNMISLRALSCPVCGRHRLFTPWIWITYFIFLGILLSLLVPFAYL